ncbi:MAG: hypothetical protein ABIH42_11260 [Planctomycetota bacterium]
MADEMKTPSEREIPRIPLAGKTNGYFKRRKLERKLAGNTLRKEPINTYIEKGERRAKRLRPKMLGTIYTVWGILRGTAMVEKRRKKARGLIRQRHGRR